MRLKFIEYLYSIMESLPLMVFLIHIQLIQQDKTENWLMPYFVSAFIGIIVSLTLCLRRRPLNLIFLGIHAYFVSGFIGVYFHVNWLNQLYGILGAAAMLFWISALCLCMTLALGSLKKRKNTEFVSLDKKSLVFVLCCALCTLVSWHNLGNRIVAEVLPFTALFFLYHYFFKHTVRVEEP